MNKFSRWIVRLVAPASMVLVIALLGSVLYQNFDSILNLHQELFPDAREVPDTEGQPQVRAPRGESRGRTREGALDEPDSPWLRGSVGPKGDTGDRGAPGPPGERGPSGPPGEVGPRGPAGEPGIPGLRGETGERGPPGPPGDRGPPGPQGEVGPRGSGGDAGIPGLRGATGDRGPPGERGPAGPPGDVGPRGSNGEPGFPGPMGQTGERGPPGERGSPGPKGEAGPQGPQGKPGDRGATLRIIRGRKSASCRAGELMISAYCVSLVKRYAAAPLIISLRGARCRGTRRSMIVIACANHDGPS